MNRNWGRIFAWLVCLALLCGLSVPALAEQVSAEPASIPLTEADAAAAAEPSTDAAPKESILDDAAITAMVEDYLDRKGISKDRIGIGYCYTATGDEFFYHPDTWFYPGSMYKVPLMMQLSERLRSGELSSDTQIGGLDLDTVYEYILVYSNNDYAHKVRSFLGGDEVWREDAKQYAGLDSYDERYMLYCYFSPRYMTRVLETLFHEPDRFPKVTDNLLKAEQGHYFRLPTSMHDYSIAQKYGSYLDNEGSNWNHTAGIIYTPNPVILTVMTKNVGGAEQVIGDLAVLFTDYTKTVDEKLDAFRAEQERLEAERLAALEAERLAAAQPAAQQAPQQASVQQPRQPQPQVQTATPDRYERGHRAGIIVLSLLLAAAIIGGVGAVVIVKERERRRYESYKRRFEAELRQEAMERERAAAGRRQPEPQRRPDATPVQRVRRPDADLRPRADRAAPAEDDFSRWLDDEDAE